MANSMWGVERANDRPIHNVLFVSRNKDNKSVENFKERREAFITNRDMIDLKSKFEVFANSGVEGETSRMYYSVNARDPQKVYNGLLHFLIDNPDFNLCSIQSKLAAIAAKKECAAEKKWMFDFDIDDEEKVSAFCNDIIEFAKDPDHAIEVTRYKTPHGYAVITNRGFDTRALYKIWNPELIELKRDDMLCCYWITK